MRKPLLLTSVPLLLLAGCGGGGGGMGPPPPPPPPGQVIATPGPPNVEPIVMDAGPANSINTGFVTVTICIPNSATCQTIDHIEVDTGSSGLRIIGSLLTINLPVETSAGGLPIAECLQFADGSSFGPVAVADMQLPTSGKTAAALSVQVIGASNYPTVPSDCPGKPENDVASFGANGILGVGPFLQDCGLACEQQVIPGSYYNCPTPSTCAAATATTAEQVSNPVSLFSADNNGVIVEMPDVASGGVATASGSLVFGIGTQSNNALGSATVLMASNVNGFIQATYNGTPNLNAALDSGSNATYFADSSIAICPSNASFFCPASTLNLTATLAGTTGSMLAADFTVVNAENALNANPSARALPGLAGPISNLSGSNTTLQFDLGMPFYFGRNVFTAIENQTTPGGMGPYYAY